MRQLLFKNRVEVIGALSINVFYWCNHTICKKCIFDELHCGTFY